ncbi:calcium/calmodulin-dependent 3',5'-cyclic nucleotide phosphodiesterase 1C [Leptonychotes weddellii]|uniref:Calcium/calmodulin-dependent 3',5'-cyclic nucleotide phosphodiesterase 1C n=1 Tax=Leptonychotes weddellii TaxID=9713 RepID=A0A7F8Q802_LEPWE|nr:calcium/calmodulin-dependent 3',5'-cyclic nucleotide phosphodiesterase 1C [Leptonychotes weddellii]
MIYAAGQNSACSACLSQAWELSVHTSSSGLKVLQGTCMKMEQLQRVLAGVANEAGDKTARPLARFSRSKSQNCLWNSLIDGLTGNAKEKPRPMIVHDPRPPEEILADELPQLDSPEALVKTSFRRLSHAPHG